jgi:hypothetical protein
MEPGVSSVDDTGWEVRSWKFLSGESSESSVSVHTGKPGIDELTVGKFRSIFQKAIASDIQKITKSLGNLISELEKLKVESGKVYLRFDAPAEYSIIIGLPEETYSRKSDVLDRLYDLSLKVENELESHDIS